MGLDKRVSKAHLRHTEVHKRISRREFDLWSTRARCAKDVRRAQRYFHNLHTKWRVVLQGRKVILAPPGQYMIGAQIFASDDKATAERKAVAYTKIGVKR